jgi:hypothetical protein
MLPLRALARPPLLYPPRQSLLPSRASEARKKHALLYLVAGVMEIGASEARKKRALLCLVAGGEVGVVEMGCFSILMGTFWQWKERFWELSDW